MTKKDDHSRQSLAAKRRKARHYAVQALYQWHMNKVPLADIEAEFRVDYDFAAVDLEYFQELLHKIPTQVPELEECFEPFLVERSLDELGPVERALLRMGTYELAERIDVPYKVVLNESVALAKKFGAAESHKYVNAVLDKVAQQLRAPEYTAPRLK
ncbi:MAG: N utilization substance protein B [Halieaceae bacterium]|jgi:N utilization substance protein B